ncbi:hypothetical protein B0H14DRAFT_3155785 [Mycena olivaceomarginata]|nr:hypothetical protein B0H14DRAFT_3155785 [Mycena olivaceomarginata]
MDFSTSRMPGRQSIAHPWWMLGPVVFCEHTQLRSSASLFSVKRLASPIVKFNASSALMNAEWAARINSRWVDGWTLAQVIQSVNPFNLQLDSSPIDRHQFPQNDWIEKKRRTQMPGVIIDGHNTIPRHPIKLRFSKLILQPRPLRTVYNLRFLLLATLGTVACSGWTVLAEQGEAAIACGLVIFLHHSLWVKIRHQQFSFLGCCSAAYPPYTPLSILVNRSLSRPLVRYNGESLICTKSVVYGGDPDPGRDTSTGNATLFMDKLAAQLEKEASESHEIGGAQFGNVNPIVIEEEPIRPRRREADGDVRDSRSAQIATGEAVEEFNVGNRTLDAVSIKGKHSARPGRVAHSVGCRDDGKREREDAKIVAQISRVQTVIRHNRARSSRTETVPKWTSVASAKNVPQILNLSHINIHLGSDRPGGLLCSPYVALPF